MAQHIGIEEIAESNELVKRSSANFAPVHNALLQQSDWQKEYPWISTIDEYGNTQFNYLQIPFVVHDLIKLRATVKDVSILSEIDTLLNFIPKGATRCYIKFIGD